MFLFLKKKEVNETRRREGFVGTNHGETVAGQRFQLSCLDSFSWRNRGDQALPQRVSEAEGLLRYESCQRGMAEIPAEPS
jgi:hypothetical protein